MREILRYIEGEVRRFLRGFPAGEPLPYCEAEVHVVGDNDWHARVIFRRRSLSAARPIDTDIVPEAVFSHFTVDLGRDHLRELYRHVVSVEGVRGEAQRIFEAQFTAAYIDRQPGVVAVRAEWDRLRFRLSARHDIRALERRRDQAEFDARLEMYGEHPHLRPPEISVERRALDAARGMVDRYQVWANQMTGIPEVYLGAGPRNESANEVMLRQREMQRLYEAGQAQMLAQLDRYSMAALLGGNFPLPEDREAEGRAEALLKSHLTPEQLKRYEAKREFEVTGQSGTCYLITYGRQQNVFKLDGGGNRTLGLCFTLKGGLAPGDCMLAQKIVLETDEAAAEAVWNPFWTAVTDWRPIGYAGRVWGIT